MNGQTVYKGITALGLFFLCTFTFMILEMFIDIQLITKYNYTPIQFTRILLLGGALIGLLLAYKTLRRVNKNLILK